MVAGTDEVEEVGELDGGVRGDRAWHGSTLPRTTTPSGAEPLAALGVEHVRLGLERTDAHDVAHLAEALAQGEAKIELAKKANDAKSAEADKLWQDAAGYYNAVAGKFPQQPEGMKAALKSAELEAGQLKNPHQGWMGIRTTLRQNPNSTLPEKAELEARRTELETTLDKNNSSSPFYKAMDILVKICGNNPKVSPVIAIFILSILVAAMLWPLQKVQYKSFKELAKYQPQIKELQTKYKGDQLLQSQKLKEFYAEHGINPTSGCLPMFFQMGITIVMLQLVWTYQFRFSQAEFLWINSVTGAASLQWPGLLVGAIGHNLGELDIPMLLLYAGSQFAQSKLIPPPTDPTQAEVQKTMTTFMPIFYFLWMFQNQMPSALMLYYFVSTLLGMWRQWTLNKQFPRDAEPVVLAATGNDDPATGELKANSKLISPKNQRKGGKK